MEHVLAATLLSSDRTDIFSPALQTVCVLQDVSRWFTASWNVFAGQLTHPLATNTCPLSQSTVVVVVVIDVVVVDEIVVVVLVKVVVVVVWMHCSSRRPSCIRRHGGVPDRK